MRQYIDILNEYLLVEDYKTAKTAFVNKGANAEDVDRVFAVYRELVNRNQITGVEKSIDWWAKNKPWEELVRFVHELSVSKSMTQIKRSKTVGDSITLHEDDNWLVVVPLDKSASCFHGRDTDWCTTKPFRSYFEKYFYNDEITLIYCISKKDGSRYAIAAHTKLTQIELFDKNDESISESEFEKATGFKPRQLVELAHKKENYSKITASREKYKAVLEIVKKKLEGDISADDRALIDQLAYLLDIDLTLSYFKKIHASGQKPSDRAMKLLVTPSVGYVYARYTIRGRWPEAEPYIMKDVRKAYLYARDIIKGRWKEAEPYIMQDVENAYAYAIDIIRGRWPEAEPYIMKDPESAYEYAIDIIQDRWPEAEPIIMKDPEFAYGYAIDIIQDRWPEAEPYIMKDPKFAFFYANSIIKGRWPKAEPRIMKDPGSAYGYARDVIKGRWPEAEPYIMKNAEFAYLYARDIIRGRWPEAEPYIMKNAEFAYLYARDIIRGRWPEAEPSIMGNAKLARKYTTIQENIFEESRINILRASRHSDGKIAVKYSFTTSFGEEKTNVIVGSQSYVEKKLKDIGFRGFIDYKKITVESTQEPKELTFGSEVVDGYGSQRYGYSFFNNELVRRIGVGNDPEVNLYMGLTKDYRKKATFINSDSVYSNILAVAKKIAKTHWDSKRERNYYVAFSSNGSIYKVIFVGTDRPKAFRVWTEIIKNMRKNKK